MQNKELEEAKQLLKKLKDGSSTWIYSENFKEIDNAIETVLTALEDSIPKEKVKKVIKEELPDDEICATCDVYDVNGIEIKKKLQDLLEGK